MAAPMHKLWLENCLQSPWWGKIAAANQSGLSETEVDHVWVGTRGQGHFLERRGKPAMPELYIEVPIPDQYGCGNPDWMDLFFEAFIRTRRQAGDWSESTAMSSTNRWIAGEKLAKLGTVNSAAQTEKTKITQHASCLKCAMIKNIEVQRLMNNQKETVGNWKVPSSWGTLGTLDPY